MAIYLADADVASLITMRETFDAVEQAFRDHGLGQAPNLPRQHLAVPKGVYRSMSAGVPSLGGMGTKVGLHSFDVPAGMQKSQALTVLYSTETGELLAVIWSDLITSYRTGAIGGVSAKYLARTDARVVGVLGSGRQARTQLMAVALARDLERALVFSPSAEHRQVFAREMSEQLGLPIEVADEPRRVVEAADIVVAATSSPRPVLEGEWLRQGAHVISVGASRKAEARTRQEMRELDDRCVERSDVVIVDSLEQALVQEGPDMMRPIREQRVRELGAVIAGLAGGRTGPEQVTLFKSFGMAIHDVAAARSVYDKAVARRMGVTL